MLNMYRGDCALFNCVSLKKTLSRYDDCEGHTVGTGPFVLGIHKSWDDID
jgi:hypothetical protein